MTRLIHLFDIFISCLLQKNMTGVTGFLYMLACFAIFYGWKKFSLFAIPNFKNFPISVQKEWWNRGTASTHAIIMFSLSARHWLVENPSMTINPPTELQYFLVEIMLGYMFYDLIIEAFAMETIVKTVLFHHAIGILSHFVTLAYSSDGSFFYTVMVYLAECSTPLLHACWMMHHLKLEHLKLFPIIMVLCLIFFFVARMLLGPFMLYHMVNHGNDWIRTPEKDFILAFQFLIVSLFVLLNGFWFVYLVKMSLSKDKRKSESKKLTI